MPVLENPVRLDMFQEIVNVHWQSNPAAKTPKYVRLSASFIYLTSDEYSFGQSTATTAATVGQYYAGCISNLKLTLHGDSFLFEDRAVVNADGELAGDLAFLSVTGQATMTNSLINPYIVATFDPWLYAGEAALLITGSGPQAVNTGKGTPSRSWSGTPVGGTPYSIYAEQLQLEYELCPITGSPDYYDLEPGPPLLITDLRATITPNVGGVAATFNPLQGVVVKYAGKTCTFVGSRFFFSGRYEYTAIFQIPEA
jgi:hypothetical protein